MAKISVSIDSSRPIFIEADAASFGEIFASANSSEQADILRAMFDELAKQGCQSDYLAMDLALPEYAETRERMRDVITWDVEDANA